MRGIVVLFVIAAAACAPRQPGTQAGPCSVRGEGASQLEQAARAPIAFPIFTRYFLGVDDGGPLTCRPGTGDCDDCRGGVVNLPIGTQSTLVVEVQPEDPAFSLAVTDVSLSDSTGGDFVLLEPLPLGNASEARPIFIGVTPASPDVVEVGVVVDTNAINDTNDGVDVFLQVRGVEP